MRSSNPSPSTCHRLTRSLAALLVAGVVVTAGSSAFALDNYASRKGLFFGLGVGGGVGGVDLADDEGQAGFEEGRLPGFHASAILGGGVNERIALGAQLNWWGRTVTKGDNHWSHHHTNFLADGNFFLIKGLYLDAGAGLAYSAFDGVKNNDSITYNEMGFALKGGAGFEYFINGTHALGVNAGYTRHFYDKATFDTFNASISIRWY